MILPLISSTIFLFLGLCCVIAPFIAKADSDALHRDFR